MPCSTIPSGELRALLPSKLNGVCDTPKKPPSAGSPQVRLPTVYMSATFGGTAPFVLPCSFEIHDPAAGQPPGGLRSDLRRPVMH